MPKEALAQQSFQAPYTASTFNKLLVITAKPGNRRHSHSKQPEVRLARTISRPRYGYLKTTVRACSHGTGLHNYVSFMHNFDLNSEWYFSCQPNQCGCRSSTRGGHSVKTITHSQQVLGHMGQDDLATVATHYIQRLLPYIANQRCRPNASYASLGQFPLTEPYLATKCCSQPSVPTIGNPTHGGGVPTITPCGSEGTRVSPNEPPRGVSPNEIPYGVSTHGSQPLPSRLPMDLAQSTTLPKRTNLLPELNDIRLQLDRDPNQQRPPRLQDSTVQPVHISTTSDTTLTHVLELSLIHI